MKTKPINSLTLQCAWCINPPIIQTPKNAVLGDELRCPQCECELAFVANLYEGMKNSPIHWVVFTILLENEEIFDFTPKVLHHHINKH